MAGMPSRLVLMICCCNSASASMPAAGGTGRVPNTRVSCPHAVLEQLVERWQLGTELMLHRREPVVGCPDPHAAELSQLLGQRHLSQQVGYALRDRQDGSRQGSAAASGPDATRAVMSTPC